MRWPLSYILSAAAAGVSVLVGAYVVWASFLSHRMVLNKFPDLASTEVSRDLASTAPEVRPRSGPLYPVDEILININEGQKVRNHLVRLKIELELFEPETYALIDERLAGVKHTVIETARLQDFRRLNTLDGKLYFKEELISRINEFLEIAAVRRIHFTNFFLQ